MEGKIIKFGQEAQGKILEGVKEAADAIGITLGAAGKMVSLDQMVGPEITRDGATVAKAIKFKDPVKNIGAQLVKKAAELTEDQAGDGTSTTSILIRELCEKGQKAIQTGSNVNEIKSGMLKAEKWMVNYIKNNADPINGDLDKIRKVATISANNDPEVGNLVVDGMKQVGVDGLITADVTAGLDTKIEITTGMKIERGWAAPQYITNPEDGKCVMEDPYILVVGEKLSTVNQVIGVMNQVISQARPILIICDAIDDIVNTALIVNVLRGNLRCCVIAGIDFGDGRKNIMNDIAVATGATYFSPDTGLSVVDAAIEHLGVAKKVVVSRDNCIIYEGQGDAQEISDLADVLKKRLEDPGMTDFDKTKFKKRLANLTGGIAVIKAGGATETEKMNRKATIEDSILASKSAIAEGCVPGGGYVYFTGAQAVKKDKAFWKSLSGDEKEGAEIVFSSLSVVLKTVVENAGESYDLVSDKLKSQAKKKIIYNVKTKTFEEAANSEVMDSAKVLRVALENSISTASMILCTDCTIVDDAGEVAEDKLV